MPKFCVLAMLEEIARSTLPEVEVLLEQRRCGPTRVIPNLCFSCEIDAKSCGRQSSIQLGVLVVGKGLVISAGGAKGGDCHQGMMAVVNPAASGLVSVRRTAVAQNRILRCCGGALETTR